GHLDDLCLVSTVSEQLDLQFCQCRSSHDFAGPVVAWSFQYKRLPVTIQSGCNIIPMEPQVTLQAMIRSIPFNETADAFGNRRLRSEIDLARQIIDIGVSCGYVAWLHRKQLTLRFFSDRF